MSALIATRLATLARRTGGGAPNHALLIGGVPVAINGYFIVIGS